MKRPLSLTARSVYEGPLLALGRHSRSSPSGAGQRGACDNGLTNGHRIRQQKREQ